MKDAHCAKIRATLTEHLSEEGPMLLDGFVVISSWSDGEGQSRWSVSTDIDLPVSQTVGLLEMAKLHVLALNDTGLPLHYEQEDDD